MSLIYEVLAERRVAVIRPKWLPSRAEWVETLRALSSDPRFERGYGVVNDRRHIPAPDAAYVRTAIDLIGSFAAGHGPLRWAIVISPDQEVVGMARMGEILAGLRNVEFRSFESYDEAVAWASPVDG